MSRSGLVAVALLLSCVGAATNYTDYVNPFIGTEGTVPGTAFNGGNTFPGATEPFGTVKIGPDTTSFNQSIGQNAGYTPDGNVTAFSLTHVSGTGGGPVYGVVSQMPLVSLSNVNVLDNLTYMEPRVGNDTARVGYYKTTFSNGIVTELSATKHAGFLQYTFPEGTERHVLVDVSHYLPSNSGGNQAQFYSNGTCLTQRNCKQIYKCIEPGESAITSARTYTLRTGSADMVIGDIEVDSNRSRYVGSGTYRGGFSHSE